MATELYHEVCGAGPPVFVIGGIHMDHRYFRPWLDRLSDVATVVYIDLPGTGKSPHPDNWDEVTHQSITNDVGRLADSLGHERFILLGHSYGGYLAQELALAHPSRLSGLILCSTGPALDYPDVIMANAQERATAAQMESVVSGLTQPSENTQQLTEIWLDILPLYFWKYEDQFHDFFADEVSYSAPAFNRAYFSLLPHCNTEDRLKDVAVPTLLITGRHDWITPVEYGSRRLNERLPNSELIVFENSGHFPFIEEKERFAATVTDWIVKNSK